VINGDEIADADFVSYVVDRDMNQPDMASIVLSNQNDIHTAAMTIGASVEIKVGKDGTSIYKGEIVGVEPVYKGGETRKILIRAMNKLHLLLRKRKSLTFMDKSDSRSSARSAAMPVCRSSGSTRSRSRTSTSTSTTSRTSSSSACVRRGWAATCGASTRSCS